LQAAGAAVMPAASMLVPVRYFPVEKRGRALGTTAVGLALGSALGPVVAGAIAGLGNWRWLFLLSLMSLVTLPFFRKYLGDDRGQADRIDWLGGGLLAAATAAYLLAITQGSWPIFAFGCLLLILFFIRIRQAEIPFIPLALFTNRKFSVGLLLAFLTAALNFSATFMAPQFLTSLNNLTPGGVGAVLFPAALASAFLGRTGGKLADRRGNGYLVVLASCLLLLGYGLLSGYVGEAAHWIALLLIASQIGQTFMQIALSNTVSRTLSKEQTGVGMGMLAMLNFIAGSLAMSVIGKLLDLTGGEAGSTQAYSSIFMTMGLTAVAIVVIYRFRFKKG